MIGSFSRDGRPRRLIRPEGRLDPTLPHLPGYYPKPKKCIVCLDTRNSNGGSRHETNAYCVVCNVPLCNSMKRNCFLKYHKDNHFWS